MATELPCYRLDKERLPALLAALADGAGVIAPLADPPGAPRFAAYHPGAAVDLGRFAHMPPKGAVFPQAETLLHYEQSAQLTVTAAPPPAEPQVVVGLRPCHSRAFQILDAFLVLGDYPVGYYQAYRDNTALVTLACNSFKQTCFCTSVDCHPADARGSDWLLHDLQTYYLVETTSAKGEDLLARLGGPAPLGLTAAGAADRDAARAQADAVAAAMPVRFAAAGMVETLAARFDHPAWRQAAQGCVNCLACTYDCPLCFCFKIEDIDQGGCGERQSCWDSCMAKSFTLMARGHQPRPTKLERYRQRILHKFQYMPQQEGLLGCTGCGACIECCPTGVDITESVKLLLESK